jgi:hypothetical protein
MKLVIDGIDYTRCVEDLDILNPEWGIDEATKTVQLMVSQELTFTEEAALFLKEKFIDACEYEDVPVNVSFDCCSLEKEFLIVPESVTYCPSECIATASLKYWGDGARCFKYLNETPWFGGPDETDTFENWAVSNGRNFKVPYVVEAGLLDLVGMYLFIFIKIIFAPLDAILTLFSLPPIVGNKIEWRVAGVNRFIICPLFKDIIEYHVDRCGLLFESSILEDPRFARLAWFDLTQDNGRLLVDCEDVDWIPESNSIITVVDVLALLEDAFNANCLIRNGVLYLERKDWFDDNRVSIGNLDENSECLEDYCISVLDRNFCAFERIAYTKDGLDLRGNLQYVDHFTEYVEYNEEAATWKSGVCDSQIPFGPSGFVLDGKDDADGYFFRWAITDLNPWWEFLPIVSNELLTQYKFFVMDSTPHKSSSVVGCETWSSVRDKVGTGEFRLFNPFVSLAGSLFNQVFPVKYDLYEFSSQLYLNEDRSDSLYNNFFFINNPNLDVRPRLRIPEIRICLDECELLDIIDEYGTDIEIETPYGTASPQRIVWDVRGDFLSLSDLIVKNSCTE